MMELSLGALFKGFNASKFVLYLSLLAFSILFSLRLDGLLPIHYAFVFIPLWICHGIVFIGGFVGSISFMIRPPSRNDITVRNDFVGMLFTMAEHVFLLAFECLTFYKLQYNGVYLEATNLQWSVVFSPVFSLSILSLGIAVWALKHDRGFEFEFFYAINIVQFFFVAFKLDDQVDWSWAVVFIPLWILLSLSAVGVLYALVLSIVLARSRHLVPTQRRQNIYSSLLHTLLVLPALACLVLLTGKLDAMQTAQEEKETVTTMPYWIVTAPMWFSLFCLVLLSFGSGGGNTWWFGMRRPFCTFLLDTCPCLRQYANVSYKIGIHRVSTSSESHVETGPDEAERPLRPIVPLTTIECPD